MELSTQPQDHKRYRLAIFCSGGGSNAQKIMAYFKDHDKIEVALLVANKEHIGALQHAQDFGVTALVTTKAQFYDHGSIVPELKRHGITHIVLAGWLWLVPTDILSAYDNAVVNIHPALLPKYGGKGMYGHHVHEAVKAAGEAYSGPTIHLANAHFDEGQVLFQAQVKLEADDSATDIAQKVLALEHQYYAPVVEAWILGLPVPEAVSL